MNSTKHTVIRFNAWWSRVLRLRWITGFGTALVQSVSYVVIGLAWVNRFFDEYVGEPRV